MPQGTLIRYYWEFCQFGAVSTLSCVGSCSAENSSCCWVLRHFETTHVISVVSDIESEKVGKFCSEALISAWGSFTCRKSTTRDPRLYFPSERSLVRIFTLWKNPSTPAGFEPANLCSNGEYDNHGTTGVVYTGRILIIRKLSVLYWKPGHLLYL